MGHTEILAALRRHLDSPDAEDHTMLPGGMRFADGDRLVTATDEQVSAVRAEIEDRCRARAAYRLIWGVAPPDADRISLR